MKLYRILELVGESSLVDLEQGAVRGFPHTTKRQHSTGPISMTGLEITPYVNTGQLRCTAQMHSAGNTYETIIQFEDVTFEDEDRPTNTTFTATDGEEYNIIPVNARDNDVKCRCNCLDFYYRFSVYNQGDGSLYGNPPPPYQRKTDNRPPVNPTKTPGLCKHLMKLADFLHQTKIVRG